MGDVRCGMCDVGWAMWERGDWERGDWEKGEVERGDFVTRNILQALPFLVGFFIYSCLIS